MGAGGIEDGPQDGLADTSEGEEWEEEEGAVASVQVCGRERRLAGSAGHDLAVHARMSARGASAPDVQTCRSMRGIESAAELLLVYAAPLALLMCLVLTWPPAARPPLPTQPQGIRMLPLREAEEELGFELAASVEYGMMPYIDREVLTCLLVVSMLYKKLYHSGGALIATEHAMLEACEDMGIREALFVQWFWGYVRHCHEARRARPRVPLPAGGGAPRQRLQPAGGWQWLGCWVVRQGFQCCLLQPVRAQHAFKTFPCFSRTFVAGIAWKRCSSADHATFACPQHRQPDLSSPGCALCPAAAAPRHQQAAAEGHCHQPRHPHRALHIAPPAAVHAARRAKWPAAQKGTLAAAGSGQRSQRDCVH